MFHNWLNHQDLAFGLCVGFSFDVYYNNYLQYFVNYLLSVLAGLDFGLGRLTSSINSARSVLYFAHATRPTNLQTTRGGGSQIGGDAERDPSLAPTRYPTSLASKANAALRRCHCDHGLVSRW